MSGIIVEFTGGGLRSMLTYTGQCGREPMYAMIRISSLRVHREWWTRHRIWRDYQTRQAPEGGYTLAHRHMIWDFYKKYVEYIHRTAHKNDGGSIIKIKKKKPLHKFQIIWKKLNGSFSFALCNLLGENVKMLLGQSDLCFLSGGSVSVLRL